MMTGIKIVRPEPDALRELRWLQTVKKLGGKLAAVDPSIIADMIELILPWVTEPEDRDEAREALLDATQNQWDELMDAIGAAARGDDDNGSNPIQAKAVAQEVRNRGGRYE